MSWPTLHTFADTDTLPASQLNGLRVAIETLETEVLPTGKITRDFNIFSASTALASAPGNVGATPTVVNAFTMNTGEVATDGSVLKIEAGFYAAANGNTKTIQIVLGTTAYIVSTSAVNNSYLIVHATIIRASATLSHLWGHTVSSGLGATVFASDAIAPLTENFANALPLQFSVTGVANNDLRGVYVHVTHSRHA